MEASSGDAIARRGPLLPGLGGTRRLTRRAIAGDPRAFSRIFELHHQELYRYCLAILRRPADAEDALQSTMTKALRALPGEQRDIELRPWLFRIAHNESIGIVRERNRGAQAAAPGTEDELPGGIEPPVAAESSERLRTLVSDLSELPERQRGALVMRELSGLGYAEIGEALSCSEGAARQSVYEARTALLMSEEGRQMECEQARKAISDGDRRRLRGRKLRAHIAGCASCRDFEAAIAARREDLAAIAPPIGAGAAAAILTAAGGGAGAGAGVGALGAGAGSVAGGFAGAGAAKGLSIAAAVVLAAGAADATGVIDVPTPFGGGNGNGSSSPAASEAGPGTGGAGEAGRQVTHKPGSTGQGAGANGKAGSNKQGNGDGAGKSGSHKPSEPGKSGDAPGKGGSSPGNSGSSPGQSGSSPGQSGSSPGQSGTTPGQSGSSPGQSGSAPGQSGSTPSQGATSPGQAGTSPGAAGTSPGQSATTPGQSDSSPGQSGAAPGQSKKD